MSDNDFEYTELEALTVIADHIKGVIVTPTELRAAWKVLNAAVEELQKLCETFGIR